MKLKLSPKNSGLILSSCLLFFTGCYSVMKVGPETEPTFTPVSEASEGYMLIVGKRIASAGTAMNPAPSFKSFSGLKNAFKKGKKVAFARPSSCSRSSLLAICDSWLDGFAQEIKLRGGRVIELDESGGSVSNRAAREADVDLIVALRSLSLSRREFGDFNDQFQSYSSNSDGKKGKKMNLPFAQRESINLDVSDSLAELYGTPEGFSYSISVFVELVDVRNSRPLLEYRAETIRSSTTDSVNESQLLYVTDAAGTWRLTIPAGDYPKATTSEKQASQAAPKNHSNAAVMSDLVRESMRGVFRSAGWNK